VSPLVDGDSGALIRDPVVLVVDPSGLLLISGSPDGERTSYFLCDTASNTVRQLPDAPGRTGAAGLIVALEGGSHNDFMVAELIRSASDDKASLRYFSPSPDGGLWSHKSLGAPMEWMAWWTDRVLSHMGKLWWVDLSHGLLAYDPFAAEMDIHFVSFPKVRTSKRLVARRAPPQRSQQPGLRGSQRRQVAVHGADNTS
jgi:hypothetical protein